MTTTKLFHRCAPIALAALLAACQDGNVAVQLAANPPAEAARQVHVEINGVTLQLDDQTTTQITLDTPAKIDLLNYDTNGFFQLFTKAKIDKGSYTGIRLDFDESDDKNNYLVDSDGNHTIGYNGTLEFTPLVFTVKKNGNKNLDAQLRLDLRLSIAPNGSGRTLTPVLRAVLTKDAASVSGSVPNSTVTGGNCKQNNQNVGVGVAIYAFNGSDVSPKDRDGSDPDPIATTPVIQSSGSKWNYTLDTLPPGDYTLALTCQGNDENPSQPDNLKFLDSHNVTLKTGEDETRDF